jgi:hypothetical protein
MFGRLFGTILATFIEKTPAKLSDARECLAETLSQARELGSPHPSSAPESPARTSGDTDPLRGELEMLKRRLSQGTESDDERGMRTVELISRSTSFFRDKGNEFHVIPFRSKPIPEGLIAFLGRVVHGNPHDKGIISINGHPYTAAATYQPRNASDLETDSMFHSVSADNQCLTYDFKSMRVAVTHYFLRSAHYDENTYHLRSWVIEVSDDEKQWKEIDRRENQDCLNGPNRVCAFEVPLIVDARFVRIRQTGTNGSGYRYLIVRAFELFGGLSIHDPSTLK